MRLWEFGAVIAMGMACPTVANAQANVAVSDWNTFCLATRGQSQDAFARADAAGWSVASQGEGRILQSDTGQRTLAFVTNGQRMCITSHPSTAELNVWSETQALLGGHPPSYRDGGWSVWVLENTGADLEMIASDETERARSAFAGGRAVLVRAGVERGLDIVMYEFRP